MMRQPASSALEATLRSRADHLSAEGDGVGALACSILLQSARLSLLTKSEVAGGGQQVGRQQLDRVAPIQWRGRYHRGHGDDPLSFRG